MADVAVQLTVNGSFYREMAPLMSPQELCDQMLKEMQDQVEELDYNALLNLTLSEEGQSLPFERTVMCVA